MEKLRYIVFDSTEEFEAWQSRDKVHIVEMLAEVIGSTNDYVGPLTTKTTNKVGLMVIYRNGEDY